jgi:hypothetical protein
MRPYSQDFQIRIYNYSLTHTVRETVRIFVIIPPSLKLWRLSRHSGRDSLPHLFRKVSE